MERVNAFASAFWQARRAGLAILVAVVVFALSFGALAHAETAWAADDERPSVLVLDAGVGDYELGSLHWIGDGARVVADANGLSLVTSNEAAWWADGGGEGAAPSTFMLGAVNKTPGADDIAWALDQIRASGAEPRTFVIAMGGSGFALREYAEDLANQKQTRRADLVGMAFCGTPHSGYSASEIYPEQSIWEAIALPTGHAAADFAPGSDFLSALDQTSFPHVTETLLVNGSVGDLGFGLTDGAGTLDNFTLNEAVTDQVVVSQVSATVSQALNLTGAWKPFTSSIDYGQRAVDSQLTERLSAFADYATSKEVQSVACDFYDSWFAERAPVTHNSSVLLLDLSGSMVEPIDASGDKLAAAKEAAKQYLRAVQSCSELPQSPPADVTTFGFGETTALVTEGFSQAACDDLDRMSASGETNIGTALERALDTLGSAPTCADKHILLLSDGESTRGLSDADMLAGPVAKAASDGIVIDAIGFGDVGESDAGFLEQVASATGGTYYQANDTYSLKVNFLKSYYSSLGLSLVDEEVDAGAQEPQGLGVTDTRTSAIQVGVVGSGDAPEVVLMRDGAALDPTQYAVRQENGLTSLQCLNPQQGEYSLKIENASGAAHVFAVKQQGVPRAAEVVGEAADYSLFLLIGAGVLLIAAIVAVVALGSRKKKRVQPAAGTSTGHGPGAFGAGSR